MSKSSSIVAKSLLNKHFISIRLGYLHFRVYQPFILDLARAFAENDEDKSDRMLPLLSIEKIANLLFKSKYTRKFFCWYVVRYATYEDVRNAATKIADVVTGKDLFDAVKIDKTKKKTPTETVGNNTIAGVITSMLEHLNITYKEAIESINYPTMLLMMIDKCRALTGGEEKIVKTSGKSMAQKRNAAKRKK